MGKKGLWDDRDGGWFFHAPNDPARLLFGKVSSLVPGLKEDSLPSKMQGAKPLMGNLIPNMYHLRGLWPHIT